MATPINNSESYIYIQESITNALSFPLCTSVMKRAADAPLGTLAKGATVEGIQFTPNSFVTVAPFRFCNGLTMPSIPDAPSLTVPGFEPIARKMRVPIVPPSSQFNAGIPDHLGDFKNSTTAADLTGVGAGNVAYREHLGALLPFDAFTDASSFSIPLDLVLGRNNVSFGARMVLGDWLDANPSVRDAARYQRDDGGADDLGAVDTQRTLAQMVLSQGGVDDNANGFGAPSGVTDAEKIKSLLQGVELRASASITSTTEDALEQVIIIKKGVKWPGDDLIRDRATGEYLRAFEGTNHMPNMGDYLDLEDSDRPFTRDFPLDLSKYALSDSISLVTDGIGDLIELPARSVMKCYITLSTSISVKTGAGQLADVFSEYDAGRLHFFLPVRPDSGLAMKTLTDEDDVEQLYTVKSSNAEYPLFAMYLDLPIDTKCPGAFVLRQGMTVPDAFKVGSGAILSESPSVLSSNAAANARRVVGTAGYAILDAGFQIINDTRLSGIVGDASQISVMPNAVTAKPLTILMSSSWEETTPFSSAFVAPGHVVQSRLTFNKAQILDSAIGASEGSMFKAGTILVNPVTKSGMKGLADLVIPSGTEITDMLDLSNHPSETDPITGSNRLVEGTLIRKMSELDGITVNTLLKAGLEITNGNTYPMPAKLLATDGYALLAGSELGKPTFGPKFRLMGMDLEPGFEFPAGTIIAAGVILSVGTDLPIGTRVPYPFPFPNGHEIKAGDTLAEGTIFRAGAALPSIRLAPQLPSLVTKVVASEDVPYMMVTMGGKLYWVIDKDTVLDRDFTLPAGAVLLAESGFAADTSSPAGKAVWVNTGASNAVAFTTAVYNSGWQPGSGDKMTIDVADYAYNVGGGSAGEVFDINPGVPTANPIRLLAEIRVNAAMAIPISDSPDLLQHVTFAVDFVIGRETSPSRSLFADSMGRILQPANTPFTAPLVLASDHVVESNMTLAKKLVLGAPNPIANYDDRVLSAAGSYIELPSHPIVSSKNVRVNSAGNVAVSAAGTKSWIQLAAGTKVSLVGGQFTVKAPTPIVADWRIEEDIVSGNPLIIAGMVLYPGSKLLGSLTMKAGSSLPDGIALSTNLTLAADYVVTDVGANYRVGRRSRFTAGSYLEVGSNFVDGTTVDDFSLGPVKFWVDGGKFAILAGNQLPAGIKHNYFCGLATSVYDYVVDYAAQIEEIANLLAVIDDAVNNNNP